MSNLDENLKNLVDNIKNDIQIDHNLSELKIALGSLNSSKLHTMTSGVQLGFIFDCLNSSNKAQVLVTCDILTMVLSVWPSQIILSDYVTPLVRALGHPIKEVKEMVLKEFIRGVGEKELLTLLNPNVIVMIINCLCDEEISVGTRAVEFLTKFGQTTEGLNLICQDVIVKELLRQTQMNDIYKIRMYQVLVDVSVYSSEGLIKIESSGLFSGLIDSLKSDDVLATMASLEVITPLVGTIHGYDFLIRNDIVDMLAQQFTAPDNSLVHLVYPGLAKFFGHIGREFPQRLFALYPQVLKEVFKGVDSSDINISIVSLETIAFIAYSPPGKAALYKQDEQYMRNTMEKLHDACTKLPIEWRVRALVALADILHLSIEFIESDITKVSQAWFNHLGPSALQNILEMARQPFPDIKAAAFHVLENVASHSWGQIKIVNQTGLFAFLLDRSTETTLEGKQAKYDVIRALYSSPTISKTFDADKCLRMANYLKEGVIYVPAGSHVAVEGAD